MSINLCELKITNRRNLKNSALVSIWIAFGGILSCSNNDSTDTTLELPTVYKKYMEPPVLLMMGLTLTLKQKIYKITKVLIIQQ